MDSQASIVLTPELLINAYANGIFPMADPDEDDQIYWYAPDPRGIIPLESFHVGRNLSKLVRSGRFRISSNEAFDDVIEACADREETWISNEIIKACSTLHRLGFAHSIEVWEEAELAGGLYGVMIRGAFFGESMFHRSTDASKGALVHLVARLKAAGASLLDVQFVTPHLAQFGAVAIPRFDYEVRLSRAMNEPAVWPDVLTEDVLTLIR